MNQQHVSRSLKPVLSLLLNVHLSTEKLHVFINNTLPHLPRWCQFWMASLYLFMLYLYLHCIQQFLWWISSQLLWQKLFNGTEVKYSKGNTITLSLRLMKDSEPLETTKIKYILRTLRQSWVIVNMKLWVALCFIIYALCSKTVFTKFEL